MAPPVWHAPPTALASTSSLTCRPSLQLLVLLRHGAFCDERGRYLSHLARHNAAAFEEALGNEMQGAAQAGLGAYRSAAAAGPSCLGLLGPATSLGIGGGSFPSLDASRGAAAMPESAVLDSAADAVAAELEGGRTALLNLAPFMNLAPTTGASPSPWARPRLPHACTVPCACASRFCGPLSIPGLPACPPQPCHASPPPSMVQCGRTRPPTVCITSSWPSPCATCAWWTGRAAAWASSPAKTWTMRRAAGGGGEWWWWWGGEGMSRSARLRPHWSNPVLPTAGQMPGVQRPTLCVDAESAAV